MKKIFSLFTLCFAANFMMAQSNYIYSLDIDKIENDQIKITATTPKMEVDKIIYHFPKVIPGTYAIEDYGKYIEDFKAFDSKGQALQVVKEGLNNYVISNARQLASIQYLVNDAMDMTVKENKIFEPASTNIEAGSNILMNNAGFFGYLTGTENLPIQLNITKPEKFYGASSLKSNTTATQQIFEATSYHQLLDCPILFAEPDTAQFMVNNCKVTIACFDESGQPRAKEFYKNLKRDMEGIAKFLPKLPVDNYTFIAYVDDFTQFGDILNGERRPSAIEAVQMYRKFKNLGVGALEHGNSSVYYLANFGDSTKMTDLKVSNQLTGAAIHEFMHIITPLGLHSQHIGNFNYAEPVMSKHLWLYEGVTEYFATLIKFQAGIFTSKEFFDDISTKYKSGEKFPLEKMTFTEMSANVLDKKYHKQYGTVYTRGAVIAMLLDARIIELTNGKKTLKDVMLAMNTKYGKDKNFEEDALFQEMTDMVSPELMEFFNKYVDGKVPLDVEKSLAPLGLVYNTKVTTMRPRNPIDEENNDIKFKKGKIKTVGKAEWAGIQKGDKPVKGSYNKAFALPSATFINGKTDEYLPEGTVVDYEVERDGAIVKLPIKIKYVPLEKTIFLGENPNATEKQKMLWKVYQGK